MEHYLFIKEVDYQHSGKSRGIVPPFCTLPVLEMKGGV